ncbi:MAG: endoribonuclease [Acidimicrobiales bacterium]|nr:endoribonuclease [Acidimicrobiales bacterium]
MKRSVTSDQAPPALGAYSPALVSDDWVFVSGQAGLRPDFSGYEEGNVGVQTTLTLANIEQLLLAAGSSLDGVVKTTCYLADMDTFAEFDAAYAAAFAAAGVEILPARTTLGANLSIAVEIDAVARLTS